MTLRTVNTQLFLSRSGTLELPGACVLSALSRIFSMSWAVDLCGQDSVLHSSSFARTMLAWHPPCLLSKMTYRHSLFLYRFHHARLPFLVLVLRAS